MTDHSGETTPAIEGAWTTREKSMFFWGFNAGMLNAILLAVIVR